MAKTFRCPNFGPYNDITKFKGVWVHINSKELKYQTAFMGDNSGGLVIGEVDGDEFIFLAPEQIMETVNNSWEPWETISSRLAGKGVEFNQVANEATAIAKAFESSWKDNLVGGYKNLSSVSKAKYKVDTPLVYENTDRREWTMDFQLAADSVENSVEMMMAVQTLRDLSLPLRSGDLNLGIELPYVFDIKTKDSDGSLVKLFDIDTSLCALTSFQPTYMSPYCEIGYPMRVTLTLTFRELSPRYAKLHQQDTDWYA